MFQKFQNWIRGSTDGSKNRKKLDGRVAAITGATSGIGKAVAEDLVKRGAKVLLLCRDVQKATDVASEIVELSQRGSCIQVYHLDLTSFASVRKCAKQIQINEFRLDYLGNVFAYYFQYFKIYYLQKSGSDFFFQNRYYSCHPHTLRLAPPLLRNFF